MSKEAIDNTSLLIYYDLSVFKQGRGLGVVVCLDADPTGLEGCRETMLDRVAWPHVEIGVMEPMSVSGRIHLNSEIDFS